MFKFFTKRWVSRKDYEEAKKEFKDLEKSEMELRHLFIRNFLKSKAELLDIINEKEKTIQRLELKLMDDEQGKGIPVQEIGRNAVFVLDEKKQIKQILDFKKEQDEGIISFCIEELKKLNEKLEDYSPSNPELAKLDVRDVVFRLSLEMQAQNDILMRALLALNLKKPVNIENNA